MKRKLLLITAFVFLASGMFTYSAALVKPGGGDAPSKDSLVVRNSQGEYVGTITQGLADESGKVLFAVISVGGQEAKKEIVVPITALSKDAKGSIILDVKKEVLGSAPRYNLSDFDDPYFAEKVYRHYGKTPPWTERKSDSEGGKKK